MYNCSSSYSSLVDNTTSFRIKVVLFETQQENPNQNLPSEPGLGRQKNLSIEGIRFELKEEHSWPQGGRFEPLNVIIWGVNACGHREVGSCGTP
ncbi:hypothetical protein CEXT_391021 [Caerostris extrusa]|uniref:Uncharacterized protein n=1 Tax=Caerostris extrusa TaxID=172846 RepID=A0AAV4QC74_CAEEX|nr:hypothetical protein CEXT_391021 [Caerostris extrusa]